VGGAALALTLADLGLIDEYEFLVQPVLAGHGPTLLAGLRERIQLELVDRHAFRSGAVALLISTHARVGPNRDRPASGASVTHDGRDGW
jgi:dihydrofolate reductase